MAAKFTEDHRIQSCPLPLSWRSLIAHGKLQHSTWATVLSAKTLLQLPFDLQDMPGCTPWQESHPCIWVLLPSDQSSSGAQELTKARHSVPASSGGWLFGFCFPSNLPSPLLD
jgi:hypothetical protein